MVARRGNSTVRYRLPLQSIVLAQVAGLESLVSNIVGFYESETRAKL